MRYIIFLFVLFIGVPTLDAQQDWEKFESIVSTRGSEPSKLGRAITKPFDDEAEKVQAIYYWVTHNIKYDYKLYKKTKKKKSKGKKISKAKQKEIKEKEVNGTLKSKKGICEQYSLVFQALCEGAGIQCVVVTGYAKSGAKISGLGEKHAWNAVYVGEDWYLVDPTFGAGYINEDDEKFVFFFNPYYFFSNPDAFKMNHLPKQERYQFTTSPINKDEYKANPAIGIGYFQNNIDMLYPNQGKLAVKKGTPIEISFTSDVELKELYIGNMKRETEVDAQYDNSGNKYTIKINTDELKSGTYAIQNGKTLLFSYRFNIN